MEQANSALVPVVVKLLLLIKLAPRAIAPEPSKYPNPIKPLPLSCTRNTRAFVVVGRKGVGIPVIVNVDELEVPFSVGRSSVTLLPVRTALQVPVGVVVRPTLAVSVKLASK